MAQAANPKVMLFADTAALGAPAMILLAVALLGFIAWLVAGTREPDLIDIARWTIVSVLGLVTIAYTGSWHEVSIDATSKLIAERHGFLGYEWESMGQRRKFQDFTTVLVGRTTSEQSSGKPNRPRKIHDFTLSLRGEHYEITLPVASKGDMLFHLRGKPRGSGVTLPPLEAKDDVLALESAALQVARLGGWEAKRRGYVLCAERGEPGDRRPQHRIEAIRDMRSPPRAEPDSGASDWFSKLPFAPKAQPAEPPRSSVTIEIVADDAESTIVE